VAVEVVVLLLVAMVELSPAHLPLALLLMPSQLL
jgi:hypothetical protein